MKWLNDIQSTVGFVAAIILIVLFAVLVSWGFTVFWVWLISYCFEFTWSVKFATGIWLSLILVGCFLKAGTYNRD